MNASSSSTPGSEDDHEQFQAELIIRFTTALPDLTIRVPDVSTQSVPWLKQQIRKHRPDETGHKKLRLIYAGRVLVSGDGKTLVDQMRFVRPPPMDKPKAVGKGKGKAVAESSSDDFIIRAYVHCSIGDDMTDEEIAQDEMEGAATTAASAANDQPSRSTLPQPLGFDRLLSAGFTQEDVAALRAQFNRIHNITAESSPETSRLLEERWIDEAAGTGAGELADGSPAGAYEDLFIGLAIGFFWPVAVLALREEGIFTKRRGMAIVAGMIVNVLAAVMKFTS